MKRLAQITHRAPTRRSASRVALVTLAAGLSLSAGSLDAQTVAVRGATIHTLAGDPVVGNIVSVDGRITAVGADAAIPSGAAVIDGAGKHVYPGLFDAATRLGLTEVGRTPQTDDFRELGSFNPHLQAMTAVHPPSAHIPVARANGITHTMVVPEGAAGGIAGQGSIVNLDGWTVEEMIITPGAGMVVSWPQKQLSGRARFFAGNISDRELEERYNEALQQLDAWIEAARDYAEAYTGGPVGRDLKLEALQPVLRREMPLVVAADDAEQITDAVAWAESQNLRIVIAGANDGLEVADLLAEKDVALILGPTQRTPDFENDPYDAPYALPGAYHAAGVKFAFATFNASDSRTLPYEAAQAVPFGLPREEALRAITVNGAEIMGLGDELGTLEPGKRANFIVTDGDPLEIQTQVLNLVIDGREVSTMNKHLELYERYRARPLPGERR